MPLRYASLCGPTPLVPVSLADGPAIWCKLEFLNPSGSTKDRIARFILEKAWRQGRLNCGDRVVEASSGSTSIALALACAQMGFKFLAVLPEGVSGERVLMIRAYGGEVVLVPKATGIRGAIAHAESLDGPGVFLPRQFKNNDNAEAHRLGTAREIIDQIPGGRVDGVVSGVGTGGTLVGLYEGFVEAGNTPVPCHARPVNLKGGAPEIECCSFSARIPGVADDLSEIFKLERLPDMAMYEIDDEHALDTTRDLIRLGFPVGPSSGLNFRAALQLFETLDNPSAQIVTVFADRMERYFTTELFVPYRDES